jgi:hypothetical protein
MRILLLGFFLSMLSSVIGFHLNAHMITSSNSDRSGVARAHSQLRPMQITTVDSFSRQEILKTLALAVLTGVYPSKCAAADTDKIIDGRLSASTIQRPGIAGPLGPSETQFPQWLLGEWDATFSFQGSSFPLGRSFAEFKQLLAGSVRTPADATGSETKVVLRWVKNEMGKFVSEDKAYNIQNYYNAFSKPITVMSAKGNRTRNVAWMPILTQRGIYEKVNQVDWLGENNMKMIVKEIAPDLSVIGATPLEGSIVSRSWSAASESTFLTSELFRIKRLSQGRVKMIDTGTGDTEVINKYELQPDGTIAGRHRVLVYLVPFPGPAGDLYADSEGRAVAVYDWTFRMAPRKASPV